MRAPAISCVLAASALAVLCGCGNPAVDQQIATLPPEVDGVPPGEYHRPGQPCLLCHGPYYGANPQFSVAGTVFATPVDQGKSPVPVGGVVVTITDSFGDTRTKTTNCIGNFFIRSDEWLPGFPLAAKIEYPSLSGPGTTPAYMSTRIGRDGSCAGCHHGPRAADTPGYVFCVDAPTDPFPAPGSDCPGVPP